jgi:uncharacterized membrane protein YccC
MATDITTRNSSETTASRNWHRIVGIVISVLVGALGR